MEIYIDNSFETVVGTTYFIISLTKFWAGMCFYLVAFPSQRVAVINSLITGRDIYVPVDYYFFIILIVPLFEI